MTQRVSIINSNDTLLVNDYDLNKLANRQTNEEGGVLFSDLSTKPEFDLTIGTGAVTAGKAIIPVTRTASQPIANETFYVLFESDSTETLATTNGNKIYIEINDTLLQDPTQIEDVPPSTDYANGIGVGELKSTASYPAHGNYLALREIDGGGSETDVRVYPQVDGDKVDMSAMTQKVVTSGRFEQTSYQAPVSSQELAPKKYVDDSISSQGFILTYTGTFGEDVDGSTTPQVVYQSDGTGGRTAGRIYKADADDGTNTDAINLFGVVTTSETSGNTGSVKRRGIIGGFTGLTLGDVYYLSTTAGGITATEGDVKVGVAVSTTELLLQIVINEDIATQATVTQSSTGTGTDTVDYTPDKDGLLYVKCTTKALGGDTQSGTSYVDIDGGIYSNQIIHYINIPTVGSSFPSNQATTQGYYPIHVVKGVTYTITTTATISGTYDSTCISTAEIVNFIAF